MSTMTVHLNPDLRAALIEQGWSGDEQGPRLLLVGSQFANKKHRHVHLEVRATSKVRLYVHPNVRHRVPTCKAQTIDVTNCNWAKSLTRWMSLTCLALQEVWHDEDAVKACRDLRLRRRDETLAAILEPIGVSPKEFETIARVDWAWVSDDEVSAHTPEVNGVMVQGLFGPSTTDWDGATRVRKVARLFTFLQQEGWR